MTGAAALMHEATPEGTYATAERSSAARAWVQRPPLPVPTSPGVRLVSTADIHPAPVAQEDPALLLRRALWNSIDRTGLRHLVHMLARYPNLATGLFLPALTMSFLFFLMSDFVALLLGVYSIATGLVFAAAAAREMARDGIDFASKSNTEEAS